MNPLMREIDRIVSAVVGKAAASPDHQPTRPALPSALHASARSTRRAVDGLGPRGLRRLTSDSDPAHHPFDTGIVTGPVGRAGR